MRRGLLLCLLIGGCIETPVPAEVWDAAPCGDDAGCMADADISTEVDAQSTDAAACTCSSVLEKGQSCVPLSPFITFECQMACSMAGKTCFGNFDEAQCAAVPITDCSAEPPPEPAFTCICY